MNRVPVNRILSDDNDGGSKKSFAIWRIRWRIRRQRRRRFALPNMHAATKGSGSNKAVWSSTLQDLHRCSFRKVMKVSNTNFDWFQIKSEGNYKIQGHSVWGVITAKIKFGFLFCCLLMRFLIFSLVFWMLRIVFNVFSMMFGKMSLLFCFFCIRLFRTNNVCVVPYGVMRNLDAIIRVRMVLCET